MKKNFGYSLIEIILVITFITVATVAIFFAYSFADEASKVSQGSQELSELSRMFVSSGRVSSNWDNFTTPNVINDKIYPSELTPDPTSKYLNGPWGPIVFVTSAQSGQANSIFIDITGVTGSACVKMIMNNAAAVCWTYVDNSPLVGISSGTNTGGGSFTSDCTGTIAPKFPSINTVTSYCATGAGVEFGLKK